MKRMIWIFGNATFAVMMMIVTMYSSTVLAGLKNSGIYIANPNAKAGETVTISSSVLSDAVHKNVVVTVGVHSISAAGAIAASPIFHQAFSGQNFVAGTKLGYKVAYKVPSNLVTGKYALVVKAGTAVHNSSLLLAQGTAAPFLMQLTGVAPAPVTPPLTGGAVAGGLRNSGIYIPTKSVKAGQAVKVSNSILADKALSNVSLSLEIRQLNASGVAAASAVVKKSFTGLSFKVNEKKAYNLDYIIPSNAATGQYIFAIYATSADGKSTFLKVDTAVGTNQISVAGTTVTPAPSPTNPPSTGAVTNYLRNSGIYVTNKTPKAGTTVKINNSILADRAVSGVTLSMEIRAVSAAGVVASSAIATKTVTGLNFAASERKAYAFDYLIPANAAGGKYIFAIYATDASKAVTHLKVDSSLGVNDLQVGGTATPAPAPVTAKYLRGINIMDLGIAKEVVPGIYGTNYTKPSLHALRSLKDRGIQVVRIPFKWERIQYVWGGPLESAYLGYLMQVLRDANSVGLKVIVDMHNYTRYRRNGVEILFSDAHGPTEAQYTDVWKKIVNAIRADANAYNAVWAYDIMNEPHNLVAAKGYATPQKLWEGYAQAAVNGIRATGEKKLIHIEGYTFSSAVDWAKNHPAPFIKDPLNNIMYHAHMYMDWNTAGKYDTKSHAEETALAKSQGHASIGARGIARLKVFADWCAKYKQQCFLGEFGWPTAGVVGASEARLWNREGEELMTYMDQIGMGGTMWATGSWLSQSGNVMVTYVLPKAGQTITPLSQAEVLERHLGK